MLGKLISMRREIEDTWGRVNKPPCKIESQEMSLGTPIISSASQLTEDSHQHGSCLLTAKLAAAVKSSVSN